MVNYLFRGICLGVGLWVGADALLPAADNWVQVDRLLEPSGNSYSVRFEGAKETIFGVNKETYAALQEGDRVTMGTSRAFGQCVYINKDGAQIYSKKDWRGWEAVIALVLFVIASGKAGNNPNQAGEDDWDFDFSDD